MYSSYFDGGHKLYDDIPGVLEDSCPIEGQGQKRGNKHWNKYMSSQSPYGKKLVYTNDSYNPNETSKIKYKDRSRHRPISKEDYRRLTLKSHAISRTALMYDPNYIVTRWPENKIKFTRKLPFERTAEYRQGEEQLRDVTIAYSRPKSAPLPATEINSMVNHSHFNFITADHYVNTTRRFVDANGQENSSPLKAPTAHDNTDLTSDFHLQVSSVPLNESNGASSGIKQNLQDISYNVRHSSQHASPQRHHEAVRVEVEAPRRENMRMYRNYSDSSIDQRHPSAYYQIRPVDLETMDSPFAIHPPGDDGHLSNDTPAAVQYQNAPVVEPIGHAPYTTDESRVNVISRSPSKMALKLIDAINLSSSLPSEEKPTRDLRKKSGMHDIKTNSADTFVMKFAKALVEVESEVDYDLHHRLEARRQEALRRKRDEQRLEEEKELQERLLMSRMKAKQQSMLIKEKIMMNRKAMEDAALDKLE